MTTALPPDPFDVRRALGATGILAAFNEAGVLAAADVHVAVRLCGLASVTDESVLLAVALAVRAPRLGHVHVDLSTIHSTAAVDTDEPIDLATLPWPSVDAWLTAVAGSGLVAIGEPEDSGRETGNMTPSDAQSGSKARPLRLLGSRLYLDRYWALERSLALDLRRGGESRPDDVDDNLLAAGLQRLFPGQTDTRQALAAACAVFGRLAVVAGGPGTGKTTTVARIVALLDEQASAAGRPPLQIALAAPTGKAAARLEEAVHQEALKLDAAPEVRERLLALRASTLHRLLGWRPGSYSRFHHDRSQRLPHDLVIVDETSMVSLSLMARLAEAIRPGARLVLVGDPGQLASIEAGAVLGDIVGPAAEGLRLSGPTRDRLTIATGAMIAATDPPPGAAVADGIVTLDRVHRFGTGIASLARAIRAGDEDATIALLRNPPLGVGWIDVDVAEASGTGPELEPVRAEAVGAATSIVEAALNGRARPAINALGAFRILCAHRRGPQGVTSWTARIEGWLESTVTGFAADDPWYAGRPLLVTENDYELGLFNGDTGVVVRRSKDRVAAVFERRGALTDFSPARLSAVQTVFAMTIHKSQGSQFDTVAVLLPAPSSPILTRELLYTAVTRARTKVVIAGTEETVRHAVSRPVARASGLRDRLWGGA